MIARVCLGVFHPESVCLNCAVRIWYLQVEFNGFWIVLGVVFLHELERFSVAFDVIFVLFIMHEPLIVESWDIFHQSIGHNAHKDRQRRQQAVQWPYCYRYTNDQLARVSKRLCLKQTLKIESRSFTG